MVNRPWIAKSKGFQRIYFRANGTMHSLLEALTTKSSVGPPWNLASKSVMNARGSRVCSKHRKMMKHAKNLQSFANIGCSHIYFLINIFVNFSILTSGLSVHGGSKVFGGGTPGNSKSYATHADTRNRQTFAI